LYKGKYFWNAANGNLYNYQRVWTKRKRGFDLETGDISGSKTNRGMNFLDNLRIDAANADR
jgi:hypothetical protein